MALNTQVANNTIHIGDLVRIFYKVVEKEKIAGRTKRAVEEKKRERLQPYEGVVIAIKGRNDNQSFTVRRIGVHGIGMERIFPVNSPWIKKVKVKSLGKVRRAKLYYLRQRVGKKALLVKEKKKQGKTKKVKKIKKKSPQKKTEKKRLQNKPLNQR